jgi:hypothetical protein
VLVAVGSVKGSPGATTLAVALTALWPQQGAVVVEADCAGGDLGARCWLPDTPGLASLATAARTGAVTLADHVARLPCGADAVVAPAGRQAATVAVGLLAEAATRVWASQRHIILDVGRLDPGSPSAALIDAADTLLITTGGDEGSLLRLAEAGLFRVPASLVLIGGSGHAASEIAAVVGLPVSAVLPWDVRAVPVLWGERAPGPAWTRRGLPAAVRALAGRLVPGDPGPTRPGRSPRAIPAAAPRRAVEPRPATGAPAEAAKVPTGLDAWLRAGRSAQ